MDPNWIAVVEWTVLVGAVLVAGTLLGGIALLVALGVGHVRSALRFRRDMHAIHTENKRRR